MSKAKRVTGSQRRRLEKAKAEAKETKATEKERLLLLSFFLRPPSSIPEKERKKEATTK